MALPMESAMIVLYLLFLLSNNTTIAIYHLHQKRNIKYRSIFNSKVVKYSEKIQY
jgi:hypothetical protein